MKTVRRNCENGHTPTPQPFAAISCSPCPPPGLRIIHLGDSLPTAIGPYRVIRLIGGGGTGRVFLARDSDGIRVAVKVAASDAGVEGLAREMAACAAVDHPNLVRMVAGGRNRSAAYVTFEHVIGMTIGQLVRMTGPLPIPLAAEYGRQVARGLAHLHAAGWVHRDVKPANLMCTRSGKVKIIDLGSAGRVDGTLQAPAGWGTMPYLAPELARRPELADPRSDVYGLGAVLYLLLTGRPPGPKGTDAGLLLWALTADARPVPRLGRSVPARLAAIVRRMLAPDPVIRIPSAALVAEMLADWASQPT